MPKRDDKYMTAQRQAIANAALDTLLEKGLKETSIRDICDRAGISMGGLYVHFADKTALVIAALEQSHEREREHLGKVKSWADYESGISSLKRDISSHRSLRRIRLSLQFAAEAILDDENPPGLGKLLKKRADALRETLQLLHQSDEIELPMGLEPTVETHTILLTGASYMAATDKDLDIDSLWEDLLDSLALTAGLKSKRKSPSFPMKKRATKQRQFAKSA